MSRSKWVLALVFLLAGCDRLSQQINRSGPLTDEEIADARADGVPLVIYEASFSHPAAPDQGTELTVRFINVSDKEIDSITLLVVSCLAPAGREDVYAALPMKGPFAAKGIFANHPTIDTTAGWSARQTSRMSIKAADVVFRDGSKQSFTEKDISKLIDDRISNYCTAATDPH